ncbi:uncharacterized protein LOC119568102 [Penaeus monodon]|uniref:uncharacterized protein LOC119568102 n=1 Tax=Penaeus monodon TaxID=6687 RepID=UPI0018A6ED6E|nr:uncharacterized protein LOC119568102 [Penaeus monodon]
MGKKRKRQAVDALSPFPAQEEKQGREERGGARSVLSPAAAAMWISLSRHSTAEQNVAMPPSRHSAATPSSSQDRKEKNCQKRAADGAPAQRSVRRGASPVLTGHTSSSGVSVDNLRGVCRSDVPTRKSFRLVGHSSNPREARGEGLLPYWLEETPWRPTEPTEVSGLPRDSGQTHQEQTPGSPGSFDVRWASLKGRNKRRLSGIAQERPPGWEDVNLEANKKHNSARRAKNKLSLRPSFVIKSVDECARGKDRPSSLDLQGPSHGARVQAGSSDVFDLKEITEKVDNIIANNSLLERQQCSFSTTNVAPHSACNSPGETATFMSSCIADRHLWSSTDSFICEDFMFSDKRRCFNDSAHEGMLQSLRSYSQIFLNQMNLDDPHEAEAQGTERSASLASSPQLTPPGSRGSGEMRSSSPAQEDISSSSRVYDRLGLAEDRECSGGRQSASPSPQGLSPGRRRHWITFDSVEHLSEDVSHTPTTDTSSIDDRHGTSPAEDGPDTENNQAGMLLKDHHGSTANLMEPRLEQPPENYQGRLVRSYSQRGRRASRRVIDSVSRRMKPGEYDKMREPIPPMFSKAALTMHTGPGLFEERQPPKIESPQRDDLESPQEENGAVARSCTSPSTKEDKAERPATPRISLTPSLPSRVGSLRLPKMPAAFVRRSVSFAGPKVEHSEIKFQRLSENRGSFRRAMSGLGALARSFKKGKANPDSPATTPLQSPGEEKRASICICDRDERGAFARDKEAKQRSAHRSASVKVHRNKQVPHAPRLPRRAIARNSAEPFTHT